MFWVCFVRWWFGFGCWVFVILWHVCGWLWVGLWFCGFIVCFVVWVFYVSVFVLVVYAWFRGLFCVVFEFGFVRLFGCGWVLGVVGC